MEMTYLVTHLATEIVTLDVIIGIAFVTLFQVGAQKIDLPKSRTALLLFLVSIGLVAWHFILIQVSQSGALVPHPSQIIPHFAYPILLGTLILVPLGLTKGLTGRVIQSIPLVWLVAFHIPRLVYGWVFLVLYEMDAVAAQFAFSAGYGDIAAGLLGLLFLYLTWLRSSLVGPVFFLWMGAGMADFAGAIYTAWQLDIATSPGLGMPELFYIPGYAVPLYIATHIYAGIVYIKQGWRVRPKAVA